MQGIICCRFATVFSGSEHMIYGLLALRNLLASVLILSQKGKHIIRHPMPCTLFFFAFWVENYLRNQQAFEASIYVLPSISKHLNVSIYTCSLQILQLLYIC